MWRISTCESIQDVLLVQQLTVANMQSSTNTDKKYFVENVDVMFESIVNICTTPHLSPNQLEENLLYWFNYKHHNF